MRDIKFRGKNVLGKWVHGDLVRTKKLTFICVPKSNTGTTNYNIEDTETIGQFTGLYDRKKVPIYEGDIVSFKVKGEPKVTQKVVMEFNEEHGAYLFGIYKGSKMPCGKTTRMNKYTRKSVYDVEVLGNKFDNPDLLGE